MRSLSPHVDDLDASLVGCEVLTPTDIESRYSVTGGQICHGEHGLDKQFDVASELARDLPTVTQRGELIQLGQHGEHRVLCGDADP